MDETNTLEKIGLLIYDRDTYKPSMAADMGISRNFLEKMHTIKLIDMPHPFKQQLAGFILKKSNELDKRLSELNKHVPDLLE